MIQSDIRPFAEDGGSHMEPGTAEVPASVVEEHRFPAFPRYVLAVVGAAAIGEIISLPLAALIDLGFRANVTGGRWQLTAPNVMLICLKGLATGYSAGWIGKKHGKLLGALAAVFFFFFIIVVSLISGIDLLYHANLAYDTKPVLWIYLAVGPAVIGGHVGMRYGRKSFGALSWHWVWFLPLCVAVLSLVEQPVVGYGLGLLKLSYQRWTWGALISPSAALCFSILTDYFFLPLQGLVAVAAIVQSTEELSLGKRWLYTILMIIAIFVVPMIAEALMWGSFPFIIDAEGVSRLRMIPFIPWPSGSYGQY